MLSEPPAAPGSPWGWSVDGEGTRGWKEAPWPSVPAWGGWRDRRRGRLGKDAGWLWGRAESKVACQKRLAKARGGRGRRCLVGSPQSLCPGHSRVKRGRAGAWAPPPPDLAFLGGRCRTAPVEMPREVSARPQDTGTSRRPPGDLGQSPCPHQHPGHSYRQGHPLTGRPVLLGGFRTLTRQARPLSWGD